MARKLTLKQKGFVKDVVKTRNLTESASRNYKVKNRVVAQQIGSENLTKPLVIEAIDKALDKAGINDTSVSVIHSRNLQQSTQLAVSQQAVRDYYTLKGYNKDTQEGKSLNVAFIINTGKDNG